MPSNYSAPAFNSHVVARYVSMLRIPSMTISDATIFSQLVGQYNRRLCSLPEMVDELNHRITSCGPESDRYRFNVGDFKIGSGNHIALEPYFHGTIPERITFRVHFLDYA